MKPRPREEENHHSRSGPNRIARALSLNYCCCHAAFALKEDGYETIMVNCNPEPSPPITTPATVLFDR